MNIRLFYEVHKTKIKIGAAIALAVIVLAIIICSIILNPEKDIPLYTRPTTIMVNDKDKVFSLSYTDKQNLKNSSSKDYVLIIEDDKEFLMTATKLEKTYNITLDKILKAEQEAFLNSLGQYNNLNDISVQTYTNISGYTYSLTYPKNSIDYVLNVFITEIKGKLYFFDTTYPKALENECKILYTDLLNSLTIK